MTTSVADLPPFTPRLEGFRLDEFHQQSLQLLAFSVEHDQLALDLAPFQIEPPPPPPEPPLPLLPYVWYPRPLKAVRDWALGRLIPPQPTSLLGKTRNTQAQQLMRPLLSGNGPVQVLGEPGLGKTTLLTYIATHERTRQRYRRIWWLGNPAYVIQTLALALNLTQTLSETDPQSQIHQIRDSLDDNTLLVIDNLTSEDVALFKNLTPHLLLGIETPPETNEPEGDAEIPPDPEGTVTLRSLPQSDALEIMLQACGLTDRNAMRGQMRAWTSHIVRLLNGHPLAITVAGALFHEDGLPMERLVDIFSKRIDPDVPNPQMALDISLDALPGDYYDLLLAFGALPATGVGFEAIIGTANLNNELASYRGLSFLIRRGFLTYDDRPAASYTVHRLIWERMAKEAAQSKKLTEHLHNWALTYARRHREDPVQIYRLQGELLHTLDQAQQQRNESFTHKFNMTLGAYLREYVPAYFPPDLPIPKLIGERARAAALVGDGLRFLGKDQFPEALAAFESGLQLAEQHGSDHDIAEALVTFAHYHRETNNYAAATKNLERAARLVYDLKAEESLHLIRIALAALYRKQERYKDALGVLDDQPDTYTERARIYMDLRQWDQMFEALDVAEGLTSYDRAAAYLQAERYADALEAIARARDSNSAFLRAMIYHLQGDLENAVRGYELALESAGKQNPLRLEVLLAMTKAIITQGDVSRAHKLLVQAHDLYPTLTKANDILKGQIFGLQAALEFLDGNPQKALDVGEQALEVLNKVEDAGHREKADIYRTMGRAYWRRGNRKQALVMFEAEVDHAQSVPSRDEARIGIALHHLADAYRANNQADRAIGNYRRALTHKNAQQDSPGYFITQTALQDTLHAAERYGQALEVCRLMLAHLNQNPSADLQYLGYTLCRQSLIEQAMNHFDQAINTLGKWLSLLAGRTDALEDSQPPIVLLVLTLAVRSLLASDRADEAQPLAEQAVSLAEQHYPSTPAAWSARRDLGQIYLALGHWQDTIDILAPILYNAVEAEVFTFALAHEYTGIALAHLGQLETSLVHFHTAREHHPIDHKKALLLERIADIHLELQDTAAAIQHVQQASPLLNRQGEPGASARILIKLARLLSGTNHYADSIEIYEDALVRLRSLPDSDPVHMAQVYMSLGDSHEAQGQYPQAAIAYRNALDTLDTARQSSPDDHRQVLVKLAATNTAMHQYEEAIVLYLQARAETDMYGTSRELGLVIVALADTFRHANRLEEALDAYEDALDVQPAEAMSHERAATLRGYGQTFSLLGQLPEAREAWTEALAITTDSPAQEIALTHRAIAQAFTVQAMYDDAEKAFRDALDYHPVDQPETAETWRLLGKMLIAADRHADAIPPLQQALDIEKGLTQQVNGRIVNTLDALSGAYEVLRNLSAAIACYHEALVYTDRNLQPIDSANRYRTLGRLYTMQSNWLETHKALEQALEIELNHKPRSDNRIAQTLEMVAQAYRREGNLHKAAEAYKRMASYANLNKTASAELKETLDTIEKYKGTLEAARASLEVLQRTRESELKDVIYVYALIAHSHAGLTQYEAANTAIDQLLTTLEKNADELSTADERVHYRALAHVFEGSQAASTGNLVEARAHFQRALHETTDVSMRWVIEQGLASVQD